MPMGNTLKLEDLLKPDCLPDESAGGENCCLGLSEGLAR